MNKIKKQMRDDFILMCEVNCVDFETVDYSKVEKDNLELFKTHLDIHGDISEFDYIKNVENNQMKECSKVRRNLL